MTRAALAAVVMVAVAAGLALRATRLDVRPMHHDEANQAVKFGALLEPGEYRYDPHDHLMSNASEATPGWDIQQARNLYNIQRWGAGYFDINDAGRVVATPLREMGAAVA